MPSSKDQRVQRLLNVLNARRVHAPALYQLVQLAQDTRFAVEFCSAGGPQALVRVLSAGDGQPAVKALAAVSISALLEGCGASGKEQAAAEFFGVDTDSRLVKLLSATHLQAQIAAARALAAMVAANEDGVTVSGLLPIATAVVEALERGRRNPNAAALLTVLVSLLDFFSLWGAMALEQLTEAGTVPIMLTLLQHSDAGLQKQAASILVGLSAVASEKVAAAGCVPVLLARLREDRPHELQVLSNVANMRDGADQIVAAGGYKAVVGLLQTGAGKQLHRRYPNQPECHTSTVGGLALKLLLRLVSLSSCGPARLAAMPGFWEVATQLLAARSTEASHQVPIVLLSMCGGEEAVTAERPLRPSQIWQKLANPRLGKARVTLVQSGIIPRLVEYAAFALAPDVSRRAALDSFVFIARCEATTAGWHALLLAGALPVAAELACDSNLAPSMGVTRAALEAARALTGIFCTGKSYFRVAALAPMVLRLMSGDPRVCRGAADALTKLAEDVDDELQKLEMPLTAHLQALERLEFVHPNREKGDMRAWKLVAQRFCLPLLGQLLSCEPQRWGACHAINLMITAEGDGHGPKQPAAVVGNWSGGLFGDADVRARCMCVALRVREGPDSGYSPSSAEIEALLAGSRFTAQEALASARLLRLLTARSAECRERLSAQPGWALELTRIMRWGCSDAQRAAAGVLRNMVLGDATVCETIMAADGFASLAWLLEKGDKLSQLAAASALRCIAKRATFRKTIKCLVRTAYKGILWSYISTDARSKRRRRSAAAARALLRRSRVMEQTLRKHVPVEVHGELGLLYSQRLMARVVTS